MSYTDFTFPLLRCRLGLSDRIAPLFPDIRPLEPGAWLEDYLRRGRLFARRNERSRGELIVAPVLLRFVELAAPRGAYYTGVTLDVAPDLGLRGECDYVLTGSPPVPEPDVPYCVVLEANRGSIEDGLGQCAAQMFAARLYNQAMNHPVERIYGCVTTGDDWHFLRLDGSALTLDADRYFVLQLGTILGILVAAVRDAAASATPVPVPTPT